MTCFFPLLFLLNCLLLCDLYSISPATLSPKYVEQTKHFKIPSFSLREKSNWYELENCLVLFPEERIPLSIIHFTGGFIAGSNIKIAYTAMLQRLAREGHLIVATEFPALSLNHRQAAKTTRESFTNCFELHIKRMLGSSISMVPIVGLSHSLGGKLTILRDSLHHEGEKDHPTLDPKRYGNIFLSFNNFGFSDSLQISQEDEKITNQLSLSSSYNRSLRDRLIIPDYEADDTDPMELLSSIGSTLSDIFGDKFVQAIKNKVTDRIKDVEFIPSPKETWELFLNRYTIPNNYLLKFRADSIDQSQILLRYLRQKRLMVDLIELPGNHLTPNLYLDEERSRRFSDNGPVKASTEEFDMESEEFMKRLLETLNTLLYKYHNDLDFSNHYLGLPSSTSITNDGGDKPSKGIQKWDNDDY